MFPIFWFVCLDLFPGYAYYGEYPLAFAACRGNEELYDYLIDHGGDPNLQDSFGNTVLHMLVIHNQSVSIFMKWKYNWIKGVWNLAQENCGFVL